MNQDILNVTLLNRLQIFLTEVNDVDSSSTASYITLILGIIFILLFLYHCVKAIVKYSYLDNQELGPKEISRTSSKAFDHVLHAVIYLVLAAFFSVLYSGNENDIETRSTDLCYMGHGLKSIIKSEDSYQYTLDNNPDFKNQMMELHDYVAKCELR